MIWIRFEQFEKLYANRIINIKVKEKFSALNIIKSVDEIKNLEVKFDLQ